MAALVLLLAVLSGGLAACERPAGQDAPAETAGDYEQSIKLRAYDVALIGLDLSALSQDYQKLGLGSDKPDRSPILNVGKLEGTASDLERAQAMAGTLPDVDPAAKRFIDALRILVTRAKAMDSYLTMRGYLTDDFAKARRDDPAMLAAYDAAIAALVPFRKALNQSVNREDTALLARLKTEGKMGDYYDVQLAQRARALRELVAASDKPLDAAGDARADSLIAGIADLLEPARAAKAAETAKLPAEQRSGLDDGVQVAAERLVGAYREYRQTRSADQRERLIDAADSLLLMAQ